jgi:hypothetical protein
VIKIRLVIANPDLGPLGGKAWCGITQPDAYKNRNFALYLGGNGMILGRMEDAGEK